MQLVGTPIGLRYFVPAPLLRNFVSSYYVFHVDVKHHVDLMRADLPQLRFMVRGSADYNFSDGSKTAATACSLLGPTFGAYRFEARGPLLVLGIGLQPAGWAALIKDDANIFANSVHDAVPLFGNILNDTLDELQAIEKHHQMAEAADRLMTTLVRNAAEPPLWFARITDKWLTSSLSPEVDDLVSAAGISSRQVERLAKRIYGAPPKLLARKYRALKAASELSQNEAPWSEVVGDAFSDQSHLIREFRQFVGVTPTQLVSRPPLVMQMSIQRRRVIDTLPELIQIT